MKKLLSVIAMLVILCGQAIAKKETISSLEIYQKGNPEKNTSRIRMPIQFPLSVSFDDETRTIEVTTPDDNIIGQVYLYDESGQLVGYIPTLNTSMTVSTPGIYTIRVEGDSWYAIRNIEV